MKNKKILKKIISLLLAFAVALPLAVAGDAACPGTNGVVWASESQAGDDGQTTDTSSGTTDTSEFDALMESDIEAVAPQSTTSTTAVGWITPSQSETETESSLDRALDEWVSYEWNDKDSTFWQTPVSILTDLTESNTVNLLKELAKKSVQYSTGLTDVIDVADTLFNSKQILDKLAKADTYDSPSTHASIRAFESLIGIYDAAADLAFFATPSVPTIIAKETAILLSYGRDFLDTDEVSNWMNSQNPIWLSILDWVAEHWNDSPADNVRDLQKNFLLWWLRVPSNVNAYKPNIYLYGDTGETWTFTFDEPELLRAVLPEYDGAWTVTIAEDGSLTVDGDGSYGYLFYESSTEEALMQKETGFVLNESDREAQLRGILAQYGFNETEINDFVDYWCEKLDADTSYMMCPQTTEAVDMLMPITIEGEEFDHYTRIWFYFEECDSGETLPEPEIEQVSHDGNALVEWGGVAK